MKITSFITATSLILALAAPVYAQTAPTTPAPTTPAPTTPAPTTPAPTTPAPTTPAPTTPAPTTPAPTTPAPTTPAPTTPAPAPTGIPAAYANVPAVQQVAAQLSVQGYSITDVVKNADGSYSVLSVAANGSLRLITINPANGAVTDTVNNGVPAGTAGITNDGQFENDNGLEMNDNGSDSNGSDGPDMGNDSNSNDGGNDSNSNDGGNNDGGNDSNSNDGGNDSND